MAMQSQVSRKPGGGKEEDDLKGREGYYRVLAAECNTMLSLRCAAAKRRRARRLVAECRLCQMGGAAECKVACDASACSACTGGVGKGRVAKESRRWAGDGMGCEGRRGEGRDAS